MATLSGQGTTEAFQFIKKHASRLSVKRLCQRLSISRSGYYDWLKRTPSVHTQQDAVLLTHIKRVFKASAERYGSPKIYQALRAESIVISRKRVARLMRENGLKARVERVYKRLSKLRAELKVLPNYRLQAPKPTGPNQQWSSDVTYIRHGRRHVFLAVIVDLWSRKIIGWSLQEKLNAELSVAALYQALKQRKPKPGLILHTDRGVEFRAQAMQIWLNKFGIRHSMNRPGQCTDNAEVESFFKTLKSELIYENYFPTVSALRDQISRYIRNFYNKVRLHSSLNYVSPIQFEHAA